VEQHYLAPGLDQTCLADFWVLRHRTTRLLWERLREIEHMLDELARGLCGAPRTGHGDGPATQTWARDDRGEAVSGEGRAHPQRPPEFPRSKKPAVIRVDLLPTPDVPTTCGP